MKYKITIEYEGTYFNGWQKQDNNLLTIQGEIEKALKKITQKDVEIFASGRTDVGVHALNQVAHFELFDKQYKPDNIKTGLNFFLSQQLIKKNIQLNKLFSTKYINYLNNNSIVIKNCEIVDNDFHSRFSTKKRIYKYIILNQQECSPFYFNRAWHIRKKLNVDLMAEASKIFLGKHDFSSFRSSDCQALSPIKTLDKLEIIQNNSEIIFTFEAKSFLHNMVRNIVGSLKAVGSEKITQQQLKNILEAKDKFNKPYELAPACGLYLVGVEY